MLRPLAVAFALLAISAPAAAAHDRQPDAEIFATDNTALITDAKDPRLNDRLERFAHRVDADHRRRRRHARAAPSCSTACSPPTRSPRSSARAASTSTT